MLASRAIRQDTPCLSASRSVRSRCDKKYNRALYCQSSCDTVLFFAKTRDNSYCSASIDDLLEHSVRIMFEELRCTPKMIAATLEMIIK